MMTTRDASPDESQLSSPPTQCPRRMHKKETPQYSARRSMYHKAATSPEARKKARAMNNKFKKILQEFEDRAFRIDKKEEEEDYSKLSRRYSGSFRIDEMEEVVDSSKLSPCYSGFFRINKEEKEMYSSKPSRRYSGCDTEEDSDIDSEEMMDINMDMSRDEMEDRLEKLSV